MRKKSLLKKVFKSRKRNLKVESQPTFLAKFKLLIKKYKSKAKLFSKKVSDSEKFKSIVKLLIMVFGYGVMINYIMFFIRSKHFILSAFAYGLLFYFLKEEFVDWFRRLIAKR